MKALLQHEHTHKVQPAEQLNSSFCFFFHFNSGCVFQKIIHQGHLKGIKAELLETKLITTPEKQRYYDS